MDKKQLILSVAKRLREAEYTKLGMDVLLAAEDIVNVAVLPMLTAKVQPIPEPESKRGPGRPKKN